MRHALALTLASALAVAPGVVSVAAQDTAKKARAAVGSHATRGVVTSIDGNRIVIARPGKQVAMTFEMNAATVRAGTLTVGAAVSIRYREEGSRHVATAVAVQQARKPAPQKSA